MKKLVFTLAFILVGAFAFANSANLNEDDNYPLTVQTSCGVTGMIIVQDGDTAADVAAMAWELNEWICG